MATVQFSNKEAEKVPNLHQWVEGNVKFHGFQLFGPQANVLQSCDNDGGDGFRHGVKAQSDSQAD